MTFYEAAVQILLREGRPLHARQIAEIALKESLLSHVGKTPEETMASRLAAMSKKSHDRRLVAVDVDVFGLAEWAVESTEGAAEKSGQVEVHEEEPTLRSRERHPKIARDNVRVAGRGERRRKFEEAEERKKKRRLGPIASVISDILERVGRHAPLFEVAASAREVELLGEDLGKDALEHALREENERREAEGQDPVFVFASGGRLGLASWGEEPDAGVEDLTAALSAAAAAVSEDRKRRAAEEAARAERAERPERPERPERAERGGPLQAAVAEQRMRTVARLRRRLSDMDGAGLDAMAQKLLAAMGYREVRSARTRPEGSLFTARRRMGLCEVRFVVRVLRSREVRREDVLELRREMGAQSGQIGVVFSPGDATREARTEVSVVGSPLVTLLCADALAEQLVERGIGVRTTTITYVELDEGGRPGREEGGREAREGGRESRDDRRERRDRERREWREKRQREREARQEAARSAAPQGGAPETPGPEESHSAPGVDVASPDEGESGPPPAG